MFLKHGTSFEVKIEDAHRNVVTEMEYASEEQRATHAMIPTKRVERAAENRAPHARVIFYDPFL